MTGTRPICIATLLALTGCATAPGRLEPQVEVEAAPTWTATETTQGAVPSDWWRSFGDERLDELIRTALARNFDLQAASARLEQAAAQARIAGADLKPQINASFGTTRQRQVFIGFPIPGQEGGGPLSTTFTRYDLGASVSWEVDLWGRVRASTRAALADLQASEADLYGARLSLAGSVARLWLAVIEAQQQVELARNSAESFRRSAEQIRARYVSGTRPAVDLRLALSNQAAAEATLERRRRQLDVAVRSLEILLGQYPGKKLLALFESSVLPDTPPEIPVGLPAELVARRPDLVAAERRLAAADQRYLSAKRSLYPRLSLTASGGTASDMLSDLLDGDFGLWTLVGNLTQPLFQGGRLRAGVDLATGGVDEALARYAGSVLTAYGEVESALAAEGFLRDQERALQETVEQLLAAESLAWDRYRNGIGDYLTVLDSQTRSFVARANLLELRRARLENRIDLYLALGGGFEVDDMEQGASLADLRSAASTRQEESR